MNYRRGSKKLTETQIAEVAELHASGIPLTQLCKSYSISSQALGVLLKRRGFPINSVKDTNTRRNKLRKYVCDEQFFLSPWDELRCYWAGFITADGSILTSGSGQKKLQIAIASDDRDHLEKFKACLQAENPIHYEKRSGFIGKHAIRSNGRVSITISSDKICDALSSNGIGPRKTSRERIPETIPKEHIHHFIRGYLDGDGWWCLGHLPGWEAAGFCGGYNILSQIQKWIRDNIPETGRPGIIQVPGMYRIQYTGGKQTRAIIRCLYKDCTIALDRKTAVATAILERHAAGDNRSTIKITINGETRSLREWTDLTGISYTTAWCRLKRGMSPQDALDNYSDEKSSRYKRSNRRNN